MTFGWGLPPVPLFAPFRHASSRSFNPTCLKCSLRTRPMVCFVNVESVDRIIFSIFNRFNEDWKNRILRVFTQAA